MTSPPSASATIHACRPWNDTGIVLQAGQVYAMAAEGEWIDLVLPSDADGNPAPSWTQRLVAGLLRAKGERYFVLMGALDRDTATLFRIGRAARIRPPRSGLLTCFANDVPHMYWNNRGEVRLTVQRIET